MIHGVKNTLIICLTILVACVLIISYNEYTNRYALIATQDSSLYIFDKKSTILNKCTDKGCVVIETKLPAKVFFPLPSDYSPSKLFGSEKGMAEEIAKTDAVKKDETQKGAEEGNVSDDSGQQEKTSSESEKSNTPDSPTKPDAIEKEKQEEEKKPEDEFVE